MPPRAAAATVSAPDAEARTTRDAILDAAERRFAERGFDGVSVREIAADAGLRNQASLYHYFKHKRAIYQAVLGRGVSSLVEIVADSGREGGLRSDDPRARAANVASYLDAVLDELVEHPHLARLIERAGLDDSAYTRSVAPRLLRPLYAQGLDVLQDAGGPWQPPELPHLAAGIYHLIFGYFANAQLLHALLGEDPHSKEALARQRRFIKTAVAQLLGIAAGGPARIARQRRKP